jgi:hypothetical protein
MAEAAGWSKLREELERIVPTPNSDSEDSPTRTDNLDEQKLVEAAKWIVEQNEMWDQLRTEIGMHRLRIRAELDAYRSRKQKVGKEPYAPGQKS